MSPECVSENFYRACVLLPHTDMHWKFQKLLPDIFKLKSERWRDWRRSENMWTFHNG